MGKKKRVITKSNIKLNTSNTQGLKMANEELNKTVDEQDPQPVEDQTTTENNNLEQPIQDTSSADNTTEDTTQQPEQEPVQDTTEPVVSTPVVTDQPTTEEPSNVDTTQPVTQDTTTQEQPIVVNTETPTTTDTTEVASEQPVVEQPTEQQAVTDNSATTESTASQSETPVETVVDTNTQVVDQQPAETTPVIDPVPVQQDQSTEQPVVDTNTTQPTVQDTQQQPTDQPAVVDTSAVNNNVNQTVVSNKPEIIDTRDENLNDFEKYERQILIDGVEHEKNLVLSLREYLQEMKPKKPIHFTDGLLKQKQLLESIKGVLRIEDKHHFKKCWKILINYFNHHSKHGHAFHEVYINRFTEHWSTGPDQLNAFRNLTHLLKETAQKGVNNVHKTVSLENITKSQYFTEEERSKLLEFYNS